MTLDIRQFVKAPLESNYYVVVDSDTKEAILIDCSCADDEIMEWVKAQHLTLKYILLTHGHFDHVLGVNYYKKKYGIRAHIYYKDKDLLAQINKYNRFLNLEKADVPSVKTFDLNASFFVGKYPVQIITTPGHTQGGVCYLIDNNLFSGDTLFHGTCGRSDLPESDEQAMQESLVKLFKKLPDETPVYPGHGAVTTIGHERWLYQE